MGRRRTRDRESNGDASGEGVGEVSADGGAESTGPDAVRRGKKLGMTERPNERRVKVVDCVLRSEDAGFGRERRPSVDRGRMARSMLQRDDAARRVRANRWGSGQREDERLQGGGWRRRRGTVREENCQEGMMKRCENGLEDSGGGGGGKDGEECKNGERCAKCRGWGGVTVGRR